MSFANCFDVVQMVTDEASAQFAPLPGDFRRRVVCAFFLPNGR